MKFAEVFICILFLAIASQAQRYPCLPSDIKKDSVVSFATPISPNGHANARQITVAQTLKKLKAKCSRGKLIDGRGKSIYFYHLQGCWGNPPADYLEILDRQKKEIKNLKKKFTVIEMTCNTSGMPLQSISRIY